MNFKVGDQCPWCKIGKLVKRTGKFSEFLGCDMYHHTGCMYIAKIEKEQNTLEQQADEFLKSHGVRILKIK